MYFNRYKVRTEQTLRQLLTSSPFLLVKVRGLVLHKRDALLTRL